MRFGQANLISSVSLIGSTFSTSAVNAQQSWAYAFQAIWTGTPLADIAIQGSCDAVPVGISGSQFASQGVVNWTNLSTASTTGRSSYLDQKEYPGVNWLRLVFTNSSGAGVLTVNYTNKGV